MKKMAAYVPLFLSIACLFLSGCGQREPQVDLALKEQLKNNSTQLKQAENECIQKMKEAQQKEKKPKTDTLSLCMTVAETKKEIQQEQVQRLLQYKDPTPKKYQYF